MHSSPRTTACRVSFLRLPTPPGHHHRHRTPTTTFHGLQGRRQFRGIPPTLGRRTPDLGTTIRPSRHTLSSNFLSFAKRERTRALAATCSWIILGLSSEALNNFQSDDGQQVSASICVCLCTDEPPSIHFYYRSAGLGAIQHRDMHQWDGKAIECRGCAND